MQEFKSLKHHFSHRPNRKHRGLHREHSQRGCAKCRSEATCKSVRSVPSVGDHKSLAFTISIDNPLNAIHDITNIKVYE